MLQPNDDNIIMGALQTFWEDDVDAVGPAVLEDLVTGKHRLERIPRAVQFDLGASLELLKLAIPLVVAVLEFVRHFRSEKRRPPSADEVLAAILEKQLGQQLELESKRAVIKYILTTEIEVESGVDKPADGTSSK
jgi:hypothetical protein